ncbi:hypothetical protein PFICI_05707 [Pestalotiopsis fici W106-1]|uniref:Fucose-specific lectin n=1 Tax=Pestalotiopsis fici (strain W106-1 / CGMCC3.15140) TaxID=1229662 RepID=W3XF64_PESFW|nr:uncharacterized protein PFICI_05707 [Pestalotiopsis fici W106-1]ETS83831.1 hypothetical protein PFICI_05707 [Pestalotiopsis fici W106-1]
MLNYEQGLEVVPGHEIPEVVPRELESIPTALDPWRAVHGPYEKECHDTRTKTPPGAEPPRPARGIFGARKAWKWWTIVLIFVLVAIAAILGGVLGSRSRSQTTDDSTTPVSDPGVFEGTDGKLRFIDRTGPNGLWSAVTTLDDVPLAPNGSFAISTDMEHGMSTVEYTLYYATESGELCGQDFAYGRTPLTGSPGDINDVNLAAANGSSIATYFPYIVTQDQDTGEMLWYGYKNHVVPYYFDLTGSSLTVIGALYTAMLVLPTNSWTYERVNTTLTAAFFYRTPEGALAFALGEPAFRSANESTIASWTPYAGATPNVSLPERSAVGGFAVASGIDSTYVSTYLLYQDDNGTIQVLLPGGKGWDRPKSFDAFNGADRGTSIACLTMGAYSQNNETNVPVSYNTDTSRCYFQSEGLLKEAWYDGAEWRDCGLVATGPAA